MKALGILSFEYNNYHLEGMADTRPIGAVSFLGRYRILDFMISNFTNSGISNINIHIKERPRSIIQHVHRTNYNINSKKGNILILYGDHDTSSKIYNTDVASYLANVQYIKQANLPYVIIGPGHFVYKIDFNDVLKKHIESGNDITMVYHNVADAKNSYIGSDILELEDGRVVGMEGNCGRYKNRSISLETYVMKTDLFIELLEKAQEISLLFWLRDIVREKLDELKVYGYHHKGYCACINSLKSYYDASMELKDYKEVKQLFKKDWPIHTMTNDSCPTLYKGEGKANNSIVGNGCIIEGEVINSIIGRNVVVNKGTVIKDSIILPSSIINKNCYIENAIIDRYAIVTHVKTLIGTKEQPLYVKRGDQI